MNAAATDPMVWFPYKPRPHQDRAVKFASEIYSNKDVGLLSADCGVGKTIAVLAGYLSARASDPGFRLIVTTRTHSQSKVYEAELTELRNIQTSATTGPLTATSMVSRVHVCPMKGRMEQLSSVGFMRQCAKMVKEGQCTYYWNCYTKARGEGRIVPRPVFQSQVRSLLATQVVTRESAVNTGETADLCPYEILRMCARESRILIGPYDYVFRERVRDALLSSLGETLPDIDLLVDEGHNLPNHVLQSEAAELSGDDLLWLRKNKTAIVKETGIRWLEETVDFLWETVMVHLDSLKDETQLNTWDVYPRFAVSAQINQLVEYSRVMEGVDESLPIDTPLDRLVAFLHSGYRATQSEDWLSTLQLAHRVEGRTPDVSDVVLQIRPLNAAGLIAPILRTARAAIVMSGTLRPLPYYGKLLGVRTAPTEDLLSPYPHGTRLILLDKKVSTKYTLRTPEMWRDIAKRIETALLAMPANKSAMIAFPSYAIMREVLSYGIECGHRAQLLEDRSVRIEEVEKAVLERPHAVFCVYGGKVSEGIDLVEKGSSMIDLIVCVGIPFSPPSSHQKALQAFFDRRYGEGAGYRFSVVIPSIRQVVQMAGRLRRSPEDRGVVVLLDKRFMRHIAMFGEDAASDLWPYEDVGELRRAIQMFNEEGLK
ncbi:MAG: ATP-dependent DNA helicase [Candidatus Thorarchaeota archaeon]